MSNDVGRKDVIEYFHCSCGDITQVVVVSRTLYDLGEDNDPQYDEDLYFHVQLSHYLPWFKRVLVGLKYIFGVDARSIHYGETLVNVSDAKRMSKILNDFVESPYSK